MSTNLSGQTGYLVDLAKRYVKKRTGLTDADLDRGGYQIHTTFEKGAVRELERSVRGALDHGLDPEARREDRHAQVGAASVRPADGAVVAVYGGPDATEHFTNNADTSGVPAGSVFKPFVLAAALEHGVRAKDGTTLRVSPESYYDTSGRLSAGVPALGSPGAVPPTPYGLPTTLRMATVLSSNATFRRLGADVGYRCVEDMAVAAGMLRSSMAPYDQEFPLGTSSPSAIRVATSYATFANDGVGHEPYSVTAVVRDGRRLAGLERPRGSRAMDKAVARSMTSVLSKGRLLAEPDLGTDTAGSASVSATAVAGASTQQNETQRAAWFAGYTSELATAVTLFRSEPGGPLLPLVGLGKEESTRGSLFPTRIWYAYMGGVSATR
ncbi:penicillin-binding transpeptidase domain-containing protein [Streptomyces baarnensis]|uniref:penicillin-binding transpeptidase domain-containing protein n=1 Tax=Streptomyces TaxID=1883 RepID=UPI0029CA261A|nr:penicillin-binding transpeptidase domain-containing protein [Streptomyces sp. ME02-6979.5a]